MGFFGSGFFTTTLAIRSVRYNDAFFRSLEATLYSNSTIHVICHGAETSAMKRFQVAKSRCTKNVKSLIKICHRASKHAKQPETG